MIPIKTPKRNKRDELHKSFDSSPTSITKITKKSGREFHTNVKRKDFEEILIFDIKSATIAVEWLLDEQILKDYQVFKNTIGKYNGKAKPTNNTGIARAIGIKIPFEGLERATGASRFEELVQDRLINEVKSWLARYEACNGTGNKWISMGWARTMGASKPTNLTPRVNLGAANSQYSFIVNNPFIDGFIILRIVAGTEWYELTFPFDNERFSRAETITKPTLRVNDEDKIIYSFTVVYNYNYSELNSTRVVTTDVGITNYATTSLYDVKTNRIIKTLDFSMRVKSLANSIKATERQVKVLQKRERKIEAGYHRRANIRKKRELAILTAQEITEFAFQNDNCVVVFEDLSWLENTMANGRWNRGELVKWSKHYAELNGSRIFKTSSYKTSQWCYLCPRGVQVLFIDWHTIICPECGVVEDRDINATGNIGRNFSVTLEKIIETRKASKTFTRVKVQRSPKVKNSLRKSRGIWAQRPDRSANRRLSIDRSKSRPTPAKPIRKFTSQRFKKEVEDIKSKGSASWLLLNCAVQADANSKVSAVCGTLKEQPEIITSRKNYNSYVPNKV